MNFAYGSAFGFVNLTGAYSTSHIHLGINDATGAPISGSNIGPLHTASGSFSGSYAGPLALTAPQQADLLANKYYLNIHSATFGGGEIRGQLVQVVPEPGSAMLLLSSATAVLGLRRRRS